MSSDEARAAAEWRFPVTAYECPEDQATEVERFVAGAEWQAERDAERIAELEAEVEHLRAQVPPCDGGCSYDDGPQEDCSAHGRRPTELWSLLHEEHEMGRAAHERAEAAEAKLAEVRGYIVAVQNSPGLADTGHRTRWLLREALAVIDGGDET